MGSPGAWGIGGCVGPPPTAPNSSVGEGGGALGFQKGHAPPPHQPPGWRCPWGPCTPHGHEHRHHRQHRHPPPSQLVGNLWAPMAAVRTVIEDEGLRGHLRGEGDLLPLKPLDATNTVKKRRDMKNRKVEKNIDLCLWISGVATPPARSQRKWSGGENATPVCCGVGGLWTVSACGPSRSPADSRYRNPRHLLNCINCRSARDTFLGVKLRQKERKTD